MNSKFAVTAAVFISIAPLLPAQDLKTVGDNLEYSREFYSGVHFSTIAESQPLFAYQRYPDNGPERIQCDAGTFAHKQHGQPWLKSQDWGESGQPVDKQTARKLDGWVKLVDAALNAAPNDVKLVDKSEEQGLRGRVQWIFEARAKYQAGPPVRLQFAKPLYDKNPNVLLHGFEGPLRVDDEKGSPPQQVKFSFGYLISVQGGYELSEAAWEDLETPKAEKEKPIDLSKIDMSPKPQDAQGFLDRGNARGFNGDRNGAIADFGRAIELDPKLTSAVYNRGIARLRKNDLEGAIADLNRAIELSPNTADYYNDRGLAKLRKSDNDGAIADFTRAIELDPKNALAYRNRALARNMKKDADGALADYNRAIELDPKNANAYNNRGNIKKAKGDLDGAIGDFTKALEIDSKLLVAYKSRAEAKRAKGDAAGAAEDLKQAGEPEAEESPAHTNQAVADLVNRGIGKGKRGDLTGAMADFNRAIQLDPKDPAAYANRAYAKSLKKDPAGAIADYNRAIELDPKNAEDYYARGNVKAQNHDVTGAIPDYDHAIELKPDFAHAYYNRAVAKKEKGDTAGSETDFKSAGRYDSSLAPAAPPTINTVSLFDGKFKIDIPSDFKREPGDPKEPKTLAKFAHEGEGAAWGDVNRGTHGLAPEELEDYLNKRVDEYNKSFKWLPKDAHLQWIHKEMVTINGWKWADWSFVPVLKGKKDYRNSPVYTRNLTTSYKGQLLEINFTTNLTTDPGLKDEIDHIMSSVHLEE